MTSRIPHSPKLLAALAVIFLIVVWVIVDPAADRKSEKSGPAEILRAPKVSAAKKRVRPRRPNIVVIQTDDQMISTFAGSFKDSWGDERLIMPQMLHGIVNQGAEFRNYYVSNPVCSPSRATLLTGQYSTNNGLRRNNGQHGGWAGWQTLPTWTENVPLTLQRAGYRTSHFGKLMNGYWDPDNDGVDLTVPPGWSHWFTTAYIARANYYGYRLNQDGRAVGPFGAEDYELKNPIEDSFGIDPIQCRVDTLTVLGGERCNYQSDVLTRQAQREIWRNSQNPRRPFYLQLDYEAPHGDAPDPGGPTPPTRYAWTAQRTELPSNPAFNEADISDKPRLIQRAVKKSLGPIEQGRLMRTYRRTLEAIRGVDDGVGAILRALRDTGQLDNTYVFFLSDQGGFLGEHRLARGKFLPYDVATKVGVAVRGPGISPETKIDEVVGNTDIPASVLQIAGAKPRYAVDGRPLQPYWSDPSLRSRRPFQLAYFGGNEGGERDPSAQGVVVGEGDVDMSGRRVDKLNRAPAVPYVGYRVGPYKFIRYRNGERELYDLRKDPDELENRAGDPGYAAVERYLVSHLRQVMKCQGASCRAQLPPWPEPAS